MTPELVVAVLIGLGTIYLMWQQNKILQKQNEIFARDVGVAINVEASKVQYRKYWPMLAMGALMILIWAAVAVDYYYVRRPFDPNSAWDDTAPLQRSYNEHFSNETVALDGRYFIRPVFDNVTFYFAGTGNFGMDDPTYILHDGKLESRLGSRNKIVTQTIQMMSNLGRASGCPMDSINLGPNGKLDTPAK